MSTNYLRWCGPLEGQRPRNPVALDSMSRCVAFWDSIPQGEKEPFFVPPRLAPLLKKSLARLDERNPFGFRVWTTPIDVVG
jgi:hypothetical protein